MGDRESTPNSPGCAVCGSALPPRLLYTTKLGPGARGSHKQQPEICLLGCPQCHTLFKLGTYDEQNAPGYFASAGFVHPRFEDYWRWSKEKLFDYLVGLANSRFPHQGRQRTAVDFGCSYGHLATKLQACGWNVIGVDIVPDILEYHRRHETFPVFPTLDTQEIPDGSVDLITMIDVIEYIPDPVSLLRVAYSKLRSPGLVVLRMRTVNGYLRLGVFLGRHLGVKIVEKIAGLYIVFFTKSGLKLTARRVGFRDARVMYGTKGYRFPLMKRAFHSLTHAVCFLTRGLVDFTTARVVELRK